MGAPLGHARASSAAPAAERSSAWIWDFSSTHSTSACSGGSRYSPTTSRTLSMNSGSVRQLERLGQVRLEPERPPDPADRRLRQPDSRRPSTPATSAWRPSAWRSSVATTTCLDLLVGDRARRARPRLVDQPVQPTLHEPPPPLAHRLRRHPNLGGDLLIRFTCRATPARSGTAAPTPATTSPAAPTAAASPAPHRSTSTRATGLPLPPPTESTINHRISGAGH